MFKSIGTAFVLSLLSGALSAAEVPLRRMMATTDARRASEGRIVRTDLTADELAAPQSAHFALRLRNKAELDRRVAYGEVIPFAEMVSRFFPTRESWNRVAAWAQSRGLSVDPEDLTHMTVFARGPVSRVARALGMRFARVIATDGSETTSGVSDPCVDEAIEPGVAGILGLQPHLKPRRNQSAVVPVGILNGSSGGTAYLLSPSTVAQWYHVSDLGYTGAGQTIAILGLPSPVAPGDLTAFWSRTGLPTTLSQFQEVDLDTLSDNEADSSEATADVEWSSAMAPGANLLYLSSVVPQEFSGWILNHLSQYPTLHQVGISFSLGYDDSAVAAGTAAQSQYFEALAAVGITVFAASGDYGSSFQPPGAGTPTTAGSDVGGITAPQYPATDPYVTGVGGTTLYCTPTLVNSAYYPGVPIVEGAWTLPTGTLPTPPAGEPAGFGYPCSTGGLSAAFDRPSWQRAAGVPSGTARCSPDVAAMATGLIPGYAYFGRDAAFSGTSQSCPIWAGIAAVVNEALARSGRLPLGMAGPKFYALAGSSAFNAMPTGAASGVDPFSTAATNGVYSVGPGYTMITGLGSPNVSNLIQALVSPAAIGSVSVSVPAPASALINGSAPVSLVATATLAPVTYQWFLDGAPISGASGPVLTVAPTAANEGNYSVTATYPSGTSSAGAGTLSVATNAWLLNLSSRALVQAGSNALFAGFVTAGGTGKTLLIRGDGPALAGFGVGSFLPDPDLTLFNSTQDSLASAVSWAPSLAATFAQVGAFALAPGSRDAALLEALPPGSYSAEVAPQSSAGGVALAEIYDADSGAPASRLVNLSARGLAGSGNDGLMGGFIIGGTSPLTVILRADGPALSAFGVPGVLGEPVLTLFDASGGVIATNSGWGNDPVVGSAAGSLVIQPLTAALSARVGAFAFATGSADSAMVVTLPPGAYSAQVTGASGSAGAAGATGVAAVEIYELR